MSSVGVDGEKIELPSVASPRPSDAYTLRLYRVRRKSVVEYSICLVLMSDDSAGVSLTVSERLRRPRSGDNARVRYSLYARCMTI